MANRRETGAGEGMRMHLLGEFRVAVGDRVVDATHWRRRKARHLLALLGLAPAATLHREQAIDLLWPDAAPAAAANSLHQTLHLARRALDSAAPGAGERLRLRDDLISLAGEPPLWVDVARFETLAQRARLDGNHEARAEAIALYAGDLLPQDRYEDWASARRETLRATWLGLLMDHAATLHARGDAGAALAAAQRLVDADPLDEAGHRLIMRIHAEGGDRRAALAQYQRLQRALARELDAEPDAETEALREEIAGGELATAPVIARDPAARPRTNLHPSPTSFVGRERELGEIRQLSAANRLLTLTGPGGSGKTRLATEAATSLLDDAPDGAWMVDLSALTDPALVPQAVAATLDIGTGPDSPALDAIARSLAGRRLLLVLDNCEHLIDAAASLATHLLRATDGVRIIATSREPLRIPGEVAWPVPSLSLPDRKSGTPVDTVLAAEAARLFVQRAQSVRPDLDVDPAAAEAIAQICHRLDGLPLALELAAARARLLSPRQIADRLDDRFRLLTAGSRTVPSRQQTLRGAIDWSHDLLDDEERRLFRHLAVFSGGFDLEMAEAVCDGDDIDVLDVLARLVDKSLVLASHANPEPRYRMLETVRAYAAERLLEAGEGERLRRRHAEACLHLAEAAEPHLRGRDQAAWMTRLDREHDNLRAAIDWLRETGETASELRLVSALAWFWHRTGNFSEAHARMSTAIGRSGGAPDAIRLKALLGAGIVCVAQGEYEDGARWLREAADLAGSTGDRQRRAVARTWLVWETLFRRGPQAAEPLAQDALATFDDADRWHLGLAHFALGFVTAEQGAMDAALAHFTDAAAIFDEIGDAWGIAVSRTELARVAFREGRPDATALADVALAASRAARNPWQVIQVLGLMIEMARARRDVARADALGAEAIALGTEIGQLANVAWVRRDLGHVALMRHDIDGAAAHFDAAGEIFRQRGYPLGMACSLLGSAAVATARGDLAGAARLLGQAEGRFAQVGTPPGPADREVADVVARAARAALGEAAFDAITAAGRSGFEVAQK